MQKERQFFFYLPEQKEHILPMDNQTVHQLWPKSPPQEGKMSRYITSTNIPKEQALPGITKKTARIHHTASISYQYLTGERMHRHAIRFHNTALRAIGNEA